MDYTTCMAVIIICLFAMGCLCCVWVTCCGIALMETKYASTFQNFSKDADVPQCNNSSSFKEQCTLPLNSPIKTITNETPCIPQQSGCALALISTSNSNIHSDFRAQVQETKLFT